MSDFEHTAQTKTGMKRLLEYFPLSQVDGVDCQWEIDGPWVIVTLRHADGERLPYCIYKATGNVYRQTPAGSVEDDPFITVTGRIFSRHSETNH